MNRTEQTGEDLRAGVRAQLARFGSFGGRFGLFESDEDGEDIEESSADCQESEETDAETPSKKSVTMTCEYERMELPPVPTEEPDRPDLGKLYDVHRAIVDRAGTTTSERPASRYCTEDIIETEDIRELVGEWKAWKYPADTLPDRARRALRGAVHGDNYRAVEITEEDIEEIAPWWLWQRRERFRDRAPSTVGLAANTIEFCRERQRGEFETVEEPLALFGGSDE